MERVYVGQKLDPPESLRRISLDRVRVMDDLFELVAVRVPRLFFLNDHIECFAPVLQVQQNLRSHIDSFLVEWCNIVQYLYLAWTHTLMFGSHDERHVERVRLAFSDHLTLNGRSMSIQDHYHEHSWYEYIRKCMFAFGNHDAIFHHFDFHFEHIPLLAARVKRILDESYFLPEFVRNAEGVVYRLFTTTPYRSTQESGEVGPTAWSGDQQDE